MSNSSLEQDKASEDLRSFLDFHEDDIAIGINDFGELKSVFKKELGRDAEWINPKTKVVFK